MKRTISVLDIDYDLMGLSRHNAVEESDWLLDHHLDDSVPTLGEHHDELVKEHEDFVNNHTSPYQALAPLPTEIAHHDILNIQEEEGLF